MYTSFADALLEHVPEFKKEWEEHRALHHEFLNHLLMEEFSSYLVDVTVNSSTTESAHILERSFALVELCAKSSDPKVVDLLNASFLPNVDPAAPWGQRWGTFMGQETKRLLHRHHLPETMGEGRPDLPRTD